MYACDRADACPAPNNNDEAEETKDERGGRGSTSSDSRSSNSSAPSIIFVGESVRDEWLAGEWMEEDDDASLPTAADMDVHRLALPKAPGAGRRMELKGAWVVGCWGGEGCVWLWMAGGVDGTKRMDARPV